MKLSNELADLLAGLDEDARAQLKKALSKKKKNVHFSKSTDEWSTPEEIFAELDREFEFSLDPCATDENAKTFVYYTVAENGLEQDWAGEIVFVNPPYSKLRDWVRKCYQESLKPGTIVVMLIPARTDTIAWHGDGRKNPGIFGKAEIMFVKGRIKFGNAENGAPFPSAVIIFGGVDCNGRTTAGRMSTVGTDMKPC